MRLCSYSERSAAFPEVVVAAVVSAPQEYFDSSQIIKILAKY